jgi:hypothetical protein
MSGQPLSTFKQYVPNITAAILNNYDCYLHPTNGPTFPNTHFDPANLVDLPGCFWNMAARAITLDDEFVGK